MSLQKSTWSQILSVTCYHWMCANLLRRLDDRLYRCPCLRSSLFFVVPGLSLLLKDHWIDDEANIVAVSENYLFDFCHGRASPGISYFFHRASLHSFLLPCLFPFPLVRIRALSTLPCLSFGASSFAVKICQSEETCLLTCQIKLSMCC